VVQISDGAVQSSGVTITIRGEGQAEATGGGTTAYGADGTVYYTPTQAETNYTAFVVIANKTSCFSASITVVTTATSVSGTVDVGAVSGDATAADNLELQYDGTGLTGDTFPAKQSQATAILADTGATIPAQITALNDPTAAEIADAVWDEPLSAHISVGSAGIYLLGSGVVATKLESALEADGAGGWQYTADALENGPIGGGDDAATIYTYFTTGSREAAFHADVSGLATPADVNAQMLDVFTVDTFAEPSSVPPATSTLVDMIHWNFTVSRNKLEQTSTTTTLRNDADSANIATSTVSDNGSTFTRGEYS
jgi:hypothetical protein